jgi:hypothetical protein
MMKLNKLVILAPTKPYILAIDSAKLAIFILVDFSRSLAMTTPLHTSRFDELKYVRLPGGKEGPMLVCSHHEFTLTPLGFCGILRDCCYLKFYWIPSLLLM